MSSTADLKAHMAQNPGAVIEDVAKLLAPKAGKCGDPK